MVKNDTELPNMPGLRHPEHEQHACVAIFHQLHCLVRESQTMTIPVWPPLLSLERSFVSLV